MVLKPNQFVLSITGDTINRTDSKARRTGMWNMYNESYYGDDSYYEVGFFVENKKHGLWRTFSKSGIILKEENYFNNFLNGEAKFYDNGQLTCVGEFLALRTDVPYDTIAVEEPVTGEWIEKIVPTSLGSVRHGFWKYYKPPFKELRRIEEYQLDELIYQQDFVTKTDSVQFENRLNKYPHKSKSLPPGFWTTDKGKAPPRYTDFPENVQYVKPNPGKKDKN